MLQVKNLSYEVVENGETLKIIDDISFDVADGEMLVITGPNGGGKSTTASLLMGIKILRILILIIEQMPVLVLLFSNRQDLKG